MELRLPAKLRNPSNTLKQSTGNELKKKATHSEQVTKHIYFSRKQLPRKMMSRLVIIDGYWLYFLAVVFAASIIILPIRKLNIFYQFTQNHTSTINIQHYCQSYKISHSSTKSLLIKI